MADDLRLIDLYRKNPILWDFRMEEYKFSERKAAVWAKIAETLGVTSGNCYYSLICLFERACNLSPIVYKF
jgi:hypothetical protein